MERTATRLRRRHEERTVFLDAFPEKVFAFADDHANLAEHMSRSSWMTLGSDMRTTMDARDGREVGSHIRMAGRILGIALELDEVVVERVPPWQKAWRTVGAPRLLVIGGYCMGFEVLRHGHGSVFRVVIDYDLPPRHRWIGHLMGGVYARWCVEQLTRSVTRHFSRRVA